MVTPYFVFNLQITCFRQTELETLQKVAEVQFKAAGLRKWTRGVRNAATAIFGKKILSASTVSGKLRTANDGPVLPGLDKNKMGVLFGE